MGYDLDTPLEGYIFREYWGVTWLGSSAMITLNFIDCCERGLGQELIEKLYLLIMMLVEGVSKLEPSALRHSL